MQATHPSRFCRLPEVIEKTGLARSTIYALIKKHEFPAQVKLTSHSSGWNFDHVLAWMDERIAASAAADNKGGV